LVAVAHQQASPVIRVAVLLLEPYCLLAVVAVAVVKTTPGSVVVQAVAVPVQVVVSPREVLEFLGRGMLVVVVMKTLPVVAVGVKVGAAGLPALAPHMVRLMAVRVHLGKAKEPLLAAEVVQTGVLGGLVVLAVAALVLLISLLQQPVALTLAAVVALAVKILAAPALKHTAQTEVPVL